MSIGTLFSLPISQANLTSFAANSRKNDISLPSKLYSLDSFQLSKGGFFAEAHRDIASTSVSKSIPALTPDANTSVVIPSNKALNN